MHHKHLCLLLQHQFPKQTIDILQKTHSFLQWHFLLLLYSLYFANEENDVIKNDMKDAPIGVKMLYDMVSKAHGNLPVIPIKTQYIYLSDDTVMYVFERKGKDNDLFRLVSSKTLKHAGSNSKYQSDDSNMMNGMRVKLTFTFSAIGTCAPIFISICGLTQKELRKEVCIILQVKGLCIGGGDVSIGNKEEGNAIQI